MDTGITDLLCWKPETNIALYINYTLKKNKINLSSVRTRCLPGQSLLLPSYQSLSFSLESEDARCFQSSHWSGHEPVTEFWSVGLEDESAGGLLGNVFFLNIKRLWRAAPFSPLPLDVGVKPRCLELWQRPCGHEESHWGGWTGRRKRLP